MARPKDKDQLEGSIPTSEAWLYRDPEALASVRRGLQEAAEGKTIFLGSFARHAAEE
jgi:hypothetical protein